VCRCAIGHGAVVGLSARMRGSRCVRAISFFPWLISAYLYVCVVMCLPLSLSVCVYTCRRFFMLFTVTNVCVCVCINRLQRASGAGLGVDRHLLGLRLTLQPDEATPALFADEAFARSSHWTLSTSNMPFCRCPHPLTHTHQAYTRPVPLSLGASACVVGCVYACVCLFECVCIMGKKCY
jgi:hypothetical protein